MMTNSRDSAVVQDPRVSVLASQVELLRTRVAGHPSAAVDTIDAMLADLHRLRQDMVTAARRDMDELLRRAAR